MEVLEYAKISAFRSVVYPYFHGKKLNTMKQSRKEPEHFKGLMSPFTRRKIRKVIDIWTTSVLVHMSMHRESISYLYHYLTFATLTLSAKQEHTDKEIKKLLWGKFMDHARGDWQVKNFLWVAEAQKNGNIHFHVLLDRPIPKELLQEKWNQVQSWYGYIDRFEKKHGHRNPNSTRIEALSRAQDIYAYLCKYFTKSDGVRKIQGRLWTSSYGLTRCESYTEPMMDNQTAGLVRELQGLKTTRKWKNDFCVFFFYKSRDALKVFCKYPDSRLVQYYDSMFYDLYKIEKVQIPEKYKPLNLKIRKH